MWRSPVRKDATTTIYMPSGTSLNVATAYGSLAALNVINGLANAVTSELNRTTLICSAFWIDVISQVTLMRWVLPKLDTLTSDGAVSSVVSAGASVGGHGHTAGVFRPCRAAFAGGRRGSSTWSHAIREAGVHGYIVSMLSISCNGGDPHHHVVGRPCRTECLRRGQRRGVHARRRPWTPA